MNCFGLFFIIIFYFWSRLLPSNGTSLNAAAARLASKELSLWNRRGRQEGGEGGGVSVCNWMARSAFILLTPQNERLRSPLPTPEMFVTKTTSFSEVGGDSHFAAALKFTSHSSSRTPPPCCSWFILPQKTPTLLQELQFASLTQQTEDTSSREIGVGSLSKTLWNAKSICPGFWLFPTMKANQSSEHHDKFYWCHRFAFKPNMWMKRPPNFISVWGLPEMHLPALPVTEAPRGGGVGFSWLLRTGPREAGTERCGLLAFALTDVLVVLAPN